jgi:ATP-dependent DNA helicase RecG
MRSSPDNRTSLVIVHTPYDQREPVEVRINPEGIDIVSYPGPDASSISRRYRTRRIGELFKELDLTEGRCTGIPKMRAAMDKNGSPPPRFSTDDGRTYFLVELPVHPDLPGVGKAHDGGHDRSETDRRILMALAEEAKSTPNLVSELGYLGRPRNVRDSMARLEKAGLIALTIPDKPRSKNQRRQLTAKGKAWLMSKTPNEAAD